MFLDLPDSDPDPLVRGMDPDPAPDPDPSIIFIYKNFFEPLINRKEPDPEPQFVISAPAGNFISAPRLSAPQH
jgi:hypothetical protein